MIIKDWFLRKNFSQNERYAIQCADEMKIERETEKAILVKWNTEWGFIKRWVPKSCFYTVAEIEAEAEKINQGLEKYEKLVEWAKSQGLKVRSRMKKSTILAIISEAGLEAPQF